MLSPAGFIWSRVSQQLSPRKWEVGCYQPHMRSTWPSSNVGHKSFIVFFFLRFTFSVFSLTFPEVCLHFVGWNEKEKEKKKWRIMETVAEVRMK